MSNFDWYQVCVKAGEKGFNDFKIGDRLNALILSEKIGKSVNLCRTELQEARKQGLLVEDVSPEETDKKVEEIGKEPVEFIVPKRKEEEIEKQEIKLPKAGRLISDFTNDISGILSNTNLLFYRNDSRQIVEIGKIKQDDDKEQTFTGFIIEKPSRFITLVEKFFVPGNVVMVKEEGTDPYSSFKSKSMTKDLSNTILDSYILEETLPKIERIFTIPLPIIYDKELTFPKVGYDVRFKSWLPHNAPKIINVKMNLEDSKGVLHNLLKEFCFQTDDDFNMAIAGLITPFLRGLYHSFNCRTPVFIYLGNRERIGKDCLAGVTGIVYEGVALEEPPLSVTGNKGGVDEELRKKILSALISGRKRLHFSNNKGYINNAVFESIITATTYSDRILGKNETPIFNNELEFSLSGNVGIGFTPDLAFRSRIINLFYDKEDTNARVFKNPTLHKWILENRGLILSAIYGLVKNWVEKGSPDGTIMFASFPEWARVCGGIMEAAGYNSPCNPSKEDLALGGDSETTDMKLLFEHCYEISPNIPLTKKGIRDLIKDEEDILVYLDFEKHSDQTKFGNKIKKFAGRVLSDIRLKIVDSSVRSSRQQYVFIKEVSDYNKENVAESGNLGNLGNFPLCEKQKNISSYNMVENPTNPAKTTKEPTDQDLVTFVKEKPGYDINEFSSKYGEDRLQKLLKEGNLFENPKGSLRVLE